MKTNKNRQLYQILTLILILTIILISSPIHSEVPDKMTFQGLLTNDAGEYLSGTYNVRCQIWDSETDGNSLWLEDQTVAVENGMCNILLGKNNPLPPIIFENYFDLWINLSLNPGNELLPRKKITSLPYSFKSLYSDTADIATHGQINSFDWSSISNIPPGFADNKDDTTQSYDWSSITSIPAGFADGTDDGNGDHDIAYSDSAFVNVTGDTMTGELNAYALSAGSENKLDGIFQLYSSSSQHPIIIGDIDDQGGRLRLKDIYDTSCVKFASGYGTGDITITKNSLGEIGFNLDGSVGSTNQPWIGIYGSSNNVIFDMSSVNDAQVVFPDGAINKYEMFAEPGIASNRTSNLITLDTNETAIALSVTISTPTDGYIVVKSNLNANMYPCNLIPFSDINIALIKLLSYIDTTNSGAFNRDISNQWELLDTTAEKYISIVNSRVFEVTGSTNLTFYLRVENSSVYCDNWIYILNSEMTAIYYPTYYGTSPLSSNDNNNNIDLSSLSNLTDNESINKNVDLIELELQATRARYLEEQHKRIADQLARQEAELLKQIEQAKNNPHQTSSSTNK